MPEPPPPHLHSLSLFNRQRSLKIPLRHLQHIAQTVLDNLRLTAELGIHFVSQRRMAEINWNYLQHEGSTDVITFDHGSTQRHLHGELFISPADAASQSRTYRTSTHAELGRYIVHGILHLAGYDDQSSSKRRVMKQAEDRLVRQHVVPALLRPTVHRRKHPA